jgi:7,8-dihydroneopterin aldolase/epimerase/oxygenase
VSDRIILKGLQVFARHGVLPEENKLGQRFALDVTAFLDLRPAGSGDDYRRTVCYDALTKLVIETVTAKRFYLIEAAAESVAQALLAAFPTIERVVVEVRKPGAAIDAVFDHVAAAVDRSRSG